MRTAPLVSATVEAKHERRRRICFVTAIPLTINAFMRAHIAALRQEFDVTLVSSGSAGDLAGLLGSHVSFVPVQIERRISLARDVVALARLWRLFRKEKFDSVHSITPKAGLLSMLAARFAGVPLRFHTFTGQIWATQRGLRRLVLKSLDRVLAMSATRLLADSHSQRLFLIDNQIVKAAGIEVLADGSFAGVDINRFKASATARLQLRAQRHILDDDIVFMFLGRLNRDKGLLDLSRAFAVAAEQNQHIHLLIVGPDEEDLEAVFSSLARHVPGRVHRFGLVVCPEHYLAAADVFCLPSHREGFGAVIIEAAAVGLPAIASRIYGITDAVEEGVTGILHTPRSDREIADAMLLFASNGPLRRQMGASARLRAVSKFSEARVTKGLADFYRDRFSADPNQ